MRYVCFVLTPFVLLFECLFCRTQLLATTKHQTRMGVPSFVDIRQFAPQGKLASKCWFSFGSLYTKLHLKWHEQSVQKLYRIHDQSLLRFDTDSSLIWGGLGHLKISQIAFPVLEDLGLVGKKRASSRTKTNYPVLERWTSSLSAPAVAAAAPPTAVCAIKSKNDTEIVFACTML